MVPDRLSQCGAETHRFRNAQVATVSSRTCRDIVNLSRACVCQAKLIQGFVDLRQPAERYISENDVLVDGHPDQSIAAASRNTRQPSHLIASEIALCYFHRYNGEPGLLLWTNICVQPELIFRMRLPIVPDKRQQVASAQRWWR